MLVLTRDSKEDTNTILIGDDIRVTVLSVGGRVAIGIEAPDHVEILRGELKSSDSELALKTPPQLQSIEQRKGQR